MMSETWLAMYLDIVDTELVDAQYTLYTRKGLPWSVEEEYLYW
jgi:hypothetical protein